MQRNRPPDLAGRSVNEGSDFRDETQLPPCVTEHPPLPKPPRPPPSYPAKARPDTTWLNALGKYLLNTKVCDTHVPGATARADLDADDGIQVPFCAPHGRVAPIRSLDSHGSQVVAGGGCEVEEPDCGSAFRRLKEKKALVTRHSPRKTISPRLLLYVPLSNYIH